MTEPKIEYLQLVTRYQAAIAGYIRSVAPGIDIDDVLQETNIVLWNRYKSFEIGTNFKAFAFRIAHLKTLETLRAKKKHAWLVFDSDLINSISIHQINDEFNHSGRQQALRECLSKLTDKDVQLVSERYFKRRTVREISKSHSRSEGAMQQVFFRIRNTLRNCIQSKVAQGEGTV